MQEAFFTNESFFSVAGATAIVVVIGNTSQSAFNFNPRWFALILSEIIAIFGVYSRVHVPSDFFIAILNGCLIYSAAAGTTTIAATTAEKGRQKGLVPPSDNRRHFTTPWF